MRRLITFMVSALVLLAIGWSSPDAKAWNMANLYLYGDKGPFAGWGGDKTNSDFKLTQNSSNSNNAYINNITFSETVYFRITEGGTIFLQPTDNLTGQNCVDVLEKDIKFDQGSANCWQLSAGTYDISVTQAAGNNRVRITKKNTPQSTAPENIRVFGDLGSSLSGENWKVDQKYYTINKVENYTENGYPVYSGSFGGRSSGTVYFRLYDGTNQVGPDYKNNSGNEDDEPVSFGTVFKGTSKAAKAYKFDNGGQDTYYIKIVVKGDRDYDVTLSKTAFTFDTPQPGTGIYVYSMGNGKYNYITTLTQGTDGIWKNETPVVLEAGKVSYCLNTADFGSSGTKWDEFKPTRYNPNNTNVDITNKTLFTDVIPNVDGSFDVNPEAKSNVTFYAQVSNDKPTGVRVSVEEQNPMKKFMLYRSTFSDEWIKVGQFESNNGFNYSISGNFKKTEGKTYYMVVDADNGTYTYWDDMILNGSSRWAPSAEDADITNKTATAISENGDNKYYTEYTADGSATFNLVWDGSKVSSLQGVVEFVHVDIPETTLYLYRTSDTNGKNDYVKVGEFSQVGSNADYSILVDCTNQGNQYVISTDDISGSVALSSFKVLYAPYASDKNYWFTDNKIDVTIRNSTDERISFHKDGANQALVVVSWNKDAGYNKMSVYFPATYYLSGDINGWASILNGANNVPTATLQPYKFELDQENPGWYILNLRNTELHGQFQILKDGNFHAAHYTNRTVTTNLGNGYDTDYNNDNTDKGKKYWSSWVPTKAEFDLNNGSGKMNMFAGQNTGLNLFINHNFYSDVTLHFKPADDETKNNQNGLLYLQGVPRDIYVYYYNQDNPHGETISIKKNAGSSMNTHNYYYNENKLLAAFDEHELTPAEKLLPGLQSFVRNTEEGTKLLRLPVPVGVETEFYADKNKYFYKWNLQGSGKVDESVEYTFKGDNIYIIYCGDNALARVLFNLVREDPDDLGKYYDTPSNDVNIPWKAVVRFMDIDVNGNAQFQKADGTYTKTRSEAVAMPLTEYIHNDMRNDDGHRDGTFSVPEGVHGGLLVYDPAWTKWHYTNKDWSPIGGVSSVVARKAESAQWYDNVYAISVANGNRDIEIEVKLLNENGGEWTEMPAMYFSDYDYDAKSDTYGGQIATGNPTTRKSTNNYKLNNDKLFAVAALPAGAGITTAVDKIGDDVDANAEVVYYNLQGLRVENPADGIFIKVQGKKATKVRF